MDGKKTRNQNFLMFQLDWGLVWPVLAEWRSGGVAEWQGQG